jgi:hypothetical protein
MENLCIKFDYGILSFCCDVHDIDLYEHNEERQKFPSDEDEFIKIIKNYNFNNDKDTLELENAIIDFLDKKEVVTDRIINALLELYTNNKEFKKIINDRIKKLLIKYENILKSGETINWGQGFEYLPLLTELITWNKNIINSDKMINFINLINLDEIYENDVKDFIINVFIPTFYPQMKDILSKSNLISKQYYFKNTKFFKTEPLFYIDLLFNEYMDGSKKNESFPFNYETLGFSYRYRDNEWIKENMFQAFNYYMNRMKNNYNDINDIRFFKEGLSYVSEFAFYNIERLIELIKRNENADIKKEFKYNLKLINKIIKLLLKVNKKANKKEKELIELVIINVISKLIKKLDEMKKYNISFDKKSKKIIKKIAKKGDDIFQPYQTEYYFKTNSVKRKIKKILK